MKRRHFIWAGVTAAVVAGGYGVARWQGAWQAARTRVNVTSAAQPATPVELAPGTVHDALWALSLPDVDGVTQLMSQWRGQRVVVNFWATWCAPCVREMPALQALADAYPNVRFIGIGIDSAANIRAFLQKVPVHYPLLVSERGGVDLLRRLGNTQGGLPFTLILGEDGRIMHRVLGEVDPEDIKQRISS